MNIVQTLQAVGPILGHALKNKQFFRPQCELNEPNPDVLCEYDVKIPMSEGFSVSASIYRSIKAAENGEKVPVVMCAHPYNNHITPALKKYAAGRPPPTISFDSLGRRKTGFLQTDKLGIA